MGMIRLNSETITIPHLPVMNPPSNPVGWFEIYVQDIERAKAFYQGLFAVSRRLARAALRR
jgi:hypothetical protein